MFLNWTLSLKCTETSRFYGERCYITHRKGEALATAGATCWPLNTHPNSPGNNLNIKDRKSPGSVLSSNTLCTPEAPSKGNTLQLLSPVCFAKSVCGSETKSEQHVPHCSCVQHARSARSSRPLKADQNAHSLPGRPHQHVPHHLHSYILFLHLP